MGTKLYFNFFIAHKLFIRKLLLFIFMLATVSVAEAQPLHWNALPTTGANVFPFNTLPATGKRVQWIVAAGEFAQPLPVGAGNNITSIWFRPNAACNATYTNLTIRMATVSTSTWITTGAFYTGAMTTVRQQNTTITQPVALTWTEIPLTTPFLYDPTMNLIIEVYQCGFTGTGFNINQQAFGVSPNRRRQFSDASSPCGSVALATGGDQNVPAIGISVTPAVPPTCFLTCPANITVSNAANQCGAVVNYPAPTSTGTCGPITSSPASGSFFPVGLTTVTATASGGGMCTFTVRVNDVQPPTITCPANITVGNSPGQCGATVTFAPTASDNCPGVTVSSSPASGSFFPRGTTTVTSTATDASGNTATCTFTVTVNDTENPTFSSPGLFPERLYYKFDGSGTTVPNLATAPPAGTATATLVGLTQGSTGKCGAALVGVGTANQSLNTNWATNMTGSWTISFWLGPNQVDNNPSYLFGDVNAGAFRAFYGGAALPNNMLLRGGSGDVLITGVNPGATFVTIVYNGTNTVVYKNGGSPQTYNVTFTNTGPGPFRVGGYSTLASINGRMDEFGMYSRALTAAEVLNLFNTCPVNINNCPSNIVVNNTPGTCGAVVTYTTPTGVDNCPGVTTTQTAGLPSGSTFPVGTTTNIFRATDAAGNIGTCTFTVTVNDTQAPVITCPANITVSTPAGSCTATVNYTVTATDNCSVATLVSTGGLASGVAYPLGTTTNTWRATDASGNTTSCSFSVTVLDGQLPVISAQPVNRTVCSGSNATFSVTSSNALTYQWQQFNGTAWVNITGATASTYTVSGTTVGMNTNTFRVIINGLCNVVTSNPATLFVNPLPTITLSAAPPPALLPGNTTTITATVNPPGGTFVWSVNGNTIPGVTGPVLGPLDVDDIGTYRAVYTDPNGCVVTSANLVVSGQASENLWVYPNPNQGRFQVRYYNQDNENLTLNIYNATGQKIFQKSFVTTTTYTSMNIDLGTGFSEGIYIVEVVNAAGKQVGARRVVIRH